jgi:hypothetical protein
VVPYNVGVERRPWHGLDFARAGTTTVRPVLNDSLLSIAARAPLPIVTPRGLWELLRVNHDANQSTPRLCQRDS